MSTKIAVRLPAGLVTYVDEAVSSGRARTRADLVAGLLARDARKHRAEQDFVRLALKGALHDPEALAIAVATASTALDD